MSDGHLTVEGVTLPSQEELDRSTAAFSDDWGEVDRVLYGLCRQHPRHDERRLVTAKMVLIDRAYQAGLERCIKVTGRQQAVVVAADFVWRHGGEVDDIVAAMAQVAEPLNAEGMMTAVEQHARFTRLLGEMPGCRRVPRSFASKYLHFHHPAVPILDGYAYGALTRLVKWTTTKKPFDAPPGADPEYADYCARFFKLYDVCRSRSLRVSVKSLDTYLWGMSG